MKKLLVIILTLFSLHSFAQDTIYVRPRGIPGAYNFSKSGDSLIFYVAGVRHALSVGLYVDTTSSLSDGSDTTVPSTKAVRNYIDANTGTVNNVDSLGGQPASYYISNAVANATYAVIGASYTKSQSDALLSAKQSTLNISQNYLVRNTASGFINSSIQDNGTAIGIGVPPSVYSNLTVNPFKYTVANKNKNIVLLSDPTGNYKVITQDSIWNGSWVVSNSTGWGSNSLLNNTGINVAVIGYQGGMNNTGNYTSGTGYQSIVGNSGAYVAANGHQSAKNNSGSFASGTGALALLNNTGSNVNATGYQSMGANTGGSSNGYGNFTLYGNTGNNSNALGHTAAEFNSGNYALAIGDASMLNNTGDSTIAVGASALKNNNSKNRIAVGNNNKYNQIFAGGIVKNFASADVLGTSITITGHGFGATGTKVNLRYDVQTGTSLGGLTTGVIYQFTVTNANTLTLSTITNAGSGTFSLSKDVDKSNSIVIGNNIDNTKANQTIIGSLGNTEVRFNGAAAIDSFQNKRVVIIGDSYSTLDKWPAYLNDSMPALAKYNKISYAIPGQYTDSMMYYYPTTAHLSKPNTGDDFWFFSYAGINDLNIGKSADTVYAHLKYLWSNARADGFKVVAFTVIKSLHLTSTEETERLKLNTYILSDPSLYDYVIDEANVFNPSVDFSVFADSTHLNPTGWKIFAGTIARTINKVPYTLSTTQPISATYPSSHTPTKFYATFSNPAISKGYTVATLPTGIIGMTAYVTDASSPSYLTTVTGGGSTVCPVFYNGTNWVCH